MERIQDFIAFWIVPALGAFVLYVWTVRCGFIHKPEWFRAIEGHSLSVGDSTPATGEGE